MLDISFDDLLIGIGILILAIMVSFVVGSTLVTIGLGLVSVGLMFHGLFNMEVVAPPSL